MGELHNTKYERVIVNDLYYLSHVVSLGETAPAGNPLMGHNRQTRRYIVCRSSRPSRVVPAFTCPAEWDIIDK